jgi:hypothetical protein
LTSLGGESEMNPEEYEAKYNIQLPVCPFCKQKMRPVRYVGYYEDFVYWECDCGEALISLRTECGAYV